MNFSHKSRRRRAGLMALCMLATCGAMLPENSVQQTVSADSIGLNGDLDGNGLVNALDLQLLKSYELGNNTLFTAGDASFGDLTGDGQVNKADVQILQDYLMSRCNGFIQLCTVYDNIYFAKHAALELAATETTNAGSLTGTYVNVDNVQGSAVTWTVQAPVEGNYRVDLRFSNGSGAVRPMALQCSNCSDTWTLSFAATSGWTDWQTYSLVLKLNAGANTLRVTSTQDAGGPNLDYLQLTRTDAKTTAPDVVDPPVTEEVTLADMPAEYTTAMERIWTNRIQDEQSTARRTTIFDQIVGGNGSINYVIRWQSYKPITLEQRQKLEQQLEEVGIKRHGQPLGIRCLMAVMRPFFHHTVKGTENIHPDDSNPLVFLCNHGEIYGPVAGMLFCPVPVRPWTISDISIDPDEVAQYVYKYTFSQMKWLGPLRWPISKLCGPLSVWAMKSVECVPVCRHKPRELTTTFRKSVEAMQAGDNLLIFPENPDADPNRPGYEHGRPGELFRGFTMLAQVYYARTGKCCRFVPMLAHKGMRTLSFGTEIDYDPEKHPIEERDRVVEEAQRQMWEMFDREEALYQEKKAKEKKK